MARFERKKLLTRKKEEGKEKTKKVQPINLNINILNILNKIKDHEGENLSKLINEILDDWIVRQLQEGHLVSKSGEIEISSKLPAFDS